MGTANQTRAKRTDQISALINDGRDPILSLVQAAKRAGLPLSSLSQAVTDGKLDALVMPDRRRYVSWSEVERYMRVVRGRQKIRPHILTKLSELSNHVEAKGLPVDLSTNHDRIHKSGREG